MSMPYTVIGEYYPSGQHAWRAWRIGRALTSMTRAAGLAPFGGIPHKMDAACAWYSRALQAGVRRTSPPGQGSDWHQDGDTTPGATMDQQVVLWANVDPTQFVPSGMRHRGDMYQPKPWEVVLFHNLAVYHRRPPTAPTARWTFRQRVQ